MIEVLVTIVIVGFGLLGLIGLMLKGLQVSADTVFRANAVTQAYDMADRMRANMKAVMDGRYNSVVPTGSATACSGAGISTAHVGKPSATIVCTATCGSACSSDAVATMDKCLWAQNNQRLIPSGAGAVCKDAANNWFTIFVSWDEGKSGETNKTFQLRFEP